MPLNKETQPNHPVALLRSFRANTLGKDMNPLILPDMGKIVPLLFFKKNGFGIK